jgi:DNA-binding NarL/FixJ family response regulator
MIRILHIDDDPVIRVWLRIVIQGFIPNSIIEEAEDGASGILKVSEKEFQLIICDVNMPNTDTTEFVKNIFLQRPDAKILMFSSNIEEAYAKQFLQIGALGYIEKNAPPTEIEKAINSCLKNKKYLSASAIQIFTRETFSKKPENSYKILSA